MQKLISLVTLSLFVVSTTASAQTAIPQSAVPAAGINSRVGVAAGVKGSVQLARDGGVGKVVSSGAEIFLGDKISTDAKGGLQILLLDQTTFTIGANSAIVVDQFIYDPANDAGKVSVRVVEGTFRFITGKIAHKNPENMQVDLPNGTIGVRGTMVMGRVNGTHSLAILTGPGDKNNTGSRHGAIIVSGKGDDASKSVQIAKTGFGTEIEGGGAPKMPFLVPQNILNDMTANLSPQNSDTNADEQKSGSPGQEKSGSPNQPHHPPGPRGSATEQAGQGRVDAGQTIFNFGHIPPPDKLIPQDIPGQFCNSADASCQTSFLSNRITKVVDLATIQSGISHFVGGTSMPFPLFDINTTNHIGDFKVFYDIDFGNRQVGGGHFGGHSRVEVLTGNNLNGGNVVWFDLAAQNFGNTGNASYFYSQVSDSNSCATCKADIKIDLLNAGGVVADIAQVDVIITGNGVTDKGTAVAPRQPGSSPP